VLSELVANVAVQRGRFYVFGAGESVMARITPLVGPTFLLKAPWRSGWSEAKSGSWRVVLGALERDKLGTFHGLGVLAGKGKVGAACVQQKLRSLGVPIPVLAEPRYWYSMHRTPRIIETDAGRERVLVQFESFGVSGPFHGTCLYARVDGKWSCYTANRAPRTRSRRPRRGSRSTAGRTGDRLRDVACTACAEELSWRGSHDERPTPPKDIPSGGGPPTDIITGVAS